MNMKMASILCLVIMLAGCVAGQQRGLVGDTYVSSSQPALALKARDLPLMGSTMGASRLTSSGAMGGLIVDSWITVYGKGDGVSPLAIVAHGEVPDGWYWDGIMRHPFSIDEGVETIGGSKSALSAIRRAATEGCFVAAICAGPTVLAKLGITENRAVTSYPGTAPQMGRCDYREDVSVVVDGRLITSRGPATALDFGLALARMLCPASKVEQVAGDMLLQFRGKL